MSSALTRSVSPARPHPRSRSFTPASPYIIESRSGHTRSPLSHMSSPVLTMQVIDVAEAGSEAAVRLVAGAGSGTEAGAGAVAAVRSVPGASGAVGSEACADRRIRCRTPCAKREPPTPPDSIVIRAGRADEGCTEPPAGPAPGGLIDFSGESGQNWMLDTSQSPGDH